MKISEIKIQNQKVLNKAQKIATLLESIENLNSPIEECNNAQLFYLSIAGLTAQQKAPLGEKFLCNKLHFQKVPPNENRGDAVDCNKKYYEFKNSFTNEKKNLNIRQIRLWQDIDYYYCIYINEENLDESLFFILTKEQMAEEVALCGSYTHGTVIANSVNEHKEYSITIPVYNDKNIKTQRWKKKYLSQKLKEMVLYES